MGVQEGNRDDAWHRTTGRNLIHRTESTLGSGHEGKANHHAALGIVSRLAVIDVARIQPYLNVPPRRVRRQGRCNEMLITRSNRRIGSVAERMSEASFNHELNYIRVRSKVGTSKEQVADSSIAICRFRRAAKGDQ